MGRWFVMFVTPCKHVYNSKVVSTFSPMAFFKVIFGILTSDSAQLFNDAICCTLGVAN